MNKARILQTILCVILFAGMAVCPVKAETGSPPSLAVTVTLGSTVYLETESLIEVTLTLTYSESATLYVAEGFKETDFSKHLSFIGPDLQIINAIPPQIQLEPVASTMLKIDNQNYYVDIIELLEPGWTKTITFNSHDSYTLTLPGPYEVKALIPIRTYQNIDLQEGDVAYAKQENVVFAGQLESNTEEFVIVADQDEDNYSWPVADGRIADPDVPDCNDKDANINPGQVEVVGDRIDNDCDPLTSDQIADGKISIQAVRHIIGKDDRNRPGSIKEPLSDLPVWVYDKSTGSCAKNYGISWQNYTNIRKYCRTVNHGKGVTGGDGMVSYDLAPGDYLAIGTLEDSAATDGENLYLGISIGEVGPGETVKKYLQLIVKANGKKVPAKYTKKTGSELLIIEPEYIEWSGTEELYPFVFESLGDWSVNTSVAPPEGFVADHESLSEEVNTELKALQFTITDIGSEWIATTVVHDLKHKGKKEKVKSKIGVKLTKKLAKKKNLTVFGKKIK